VTRVAIVTDSTCDLPQALFEELSVAMVPVRVFFGSENYLDKVTITPAEFYARFAVTPANHPAYVQFAAAVVLIFGIGFWFVAQAPERNRDIIKLGVLFKIAYSSVVLGWWFQGQMPGMWVPFAWIDLVFLAAFLAALRALPAGPARAS